MLALRRLSVRALLLVAAALPAGACSGDEQPAASGGREAVAPVESQRAADLGQVKRFLLSHTDRLTRFTADFETGADRYYELARRAGFDGERLWPAERKQVGPLLRRLKDSWIAGNPLYERVEGVVAGTPSLAQYDVILDAGASAAEDPEGAVPFDLTLADGRVLKQPGNLFNLTEGALWGTLPASLDQVAGTAVDLDGDGMHEWGETLPDAAFLRAAAAAFDRYATDLDHAAHAWAPTPSDAFTALVVMVPTMSEYFGQWKESRFVRGARSQSESFNVVSRLSDVRDIVSGLTVIYGGVERLATQAGPDQSGQTGRELADLHAFVGDLYAQESGGKRFTPEQAELLGAEAQGRATAIAGQVSQLAAELEIPIQQ